MHDLNPEINQEWNNLHEFVSIIVETLIVCALRNQKFHLV